MESLSASAQYLSIEVKKIKKVIKVNKKTSSLISKTLDFFLMTLAIGFVNLLSKRQNIQIPFYIFVMFR